MAVFVILLVGAAVMAFAGVVCAACSAMTHRFKPEGYSTTVTYNPPGALMTLYGRWWRQSFLGAGVLLAGALIAGVLVALF